MLKEGDKLPRLYLNDENNNPHNLYDYVSNKGLVVYFYPKDGTPGCTAQACSFRDSYEDFIKAGANVVGISKDTPSSHKKFKADYRLPFPLLSDIDGKASEQFGVPKLLGFLEGRVTFVADKNGVIIYTFNSSLLPTKHIANALEAIQKQN
jgi:peroxiredoxin Q/BCP